MPLADSIAVINTQAVATGAAQSIPSRPGSFLGICGSGWVSTMTDAQTYSNEVVATSSGNGSGYVRQAITMGTPTGTPAITTTSTNNLTFPNTGQGSALTATFLCGAATGTSAAIIFTAPIVGGSVTPAAGTDITIAAGGVTFNGK